MYVVLFECDCSEYGNLQTLNPSHQRLSFHPPAACCPLVRYHCQYIFMSARKLRSSRGNQGSPPKQRQKRGHSNADEANPKRLKTNDDDDIEINDSGPQPVKKPATKGKGKKGKKTRCVAYHR
jgi:hypothetical protein